MLVGELLEPRKLSELIREGAKLRPQVHGAYFDKADCGNEICIGSCALGAAYEAITGRHEISLSLFDVIEEATGTDLVETDLKMPAPEFKKAALCNAITTMNDDLLWTREDIADWLAENGY